MRDYSKVSPQFWIGKTGKALRKQGHDAQIVALYLMTCASSNMIGLYYLPMVTLAHEIGMSLEGASKGLQSAIEAGFCSYDEESEVVWVYEMAGFQIGEQLEEKDNRCKGIQNEYDAQPESPFLLAFYQKYQAAFHMKKARGIKAPSKPLVSQEQEQEQEQKQEQEQEQEQEGSAPEKSGSAQKPKVPGTGETWKAYSDAYFNRYGTEPVRNAKVNSLIVQFVKRLGEIESPHVAAFYLTHNNAFYVKKMHQLELMLDDAEKLRTEWVTNTQMTQTKAIQADKTQTNHDAFAPLIAEAKAKEAVNGV